MTREEKEQAPTRGEMLWWAQIIVALMIAVASALGWYLTDMKGDIQRSIQSQESRTFSMIDRVRTESMERHNDVREELGKNRIEYDPLPTGR